MPDQLQPGPELNALIAEKVMGWTRAEGAGYHCYQDWWKGSPERRMVSYWNPSRDIADAWLVVERMGGYWQIQRMVNDLWSASHASAQPIYEPTAPHAICIAALKAMETSNA